MNEQMRDHPSRWHKVPSYFDLAQRLIYNEDSPENVPSNANIDRILAHEEIVRKKKKRLLDEKKKMEENEAALQMELGQDLVNAEKAEQLGKKDGLLVGLDPLRPILFPIQQQLRDIVVILRIARCIFTWNEAYYAFWITTACFALSLAFLFIPWTFLWRWLLRILVLVGLGPWMAIVDKKYFTKEPQLTERDRDEAFEKRLKNRYDEVLLSSKNYFQRKERAMKLKAMKKYLFGNRTLKVPIVCEDLFPDTPLPSSSCSPFDPLACDPIEMAHVKFGQTLKGDMIPQREIQITSTFGKKVDPRKKWNRFLRKK